MGLKKLCHRQNNINRYLPINIEMTQTAEEKVYSILYNLLGNYYDKVMVLHLFSFKTPIIDAKK